MGFCIRARKSQREHKTIQKGRMPSSGMRYIVAYVITNVSRELIASMITVIIMRKLGTTLAGTINRSKLLTLLGRWFFSHWWWRRYVPPKSRFLQEPPGVTSQKAAFFIVTAVQNSNLTSGRTRLFCPLRKHCITMGKYRRHTRLQ
jgi:hypothetical protein